VIGLGLGTAEAMLINSGLTVGSVSSSSWGTTAGAVVRTNPGAFSSVPRGTPVNIIVDSG